MFPRSVIASYVSKSLGKNMKKSLEIVTVGITQGGLSRLAAAPTLVLRHT